MTQEYRGASSRWPDELRSERETIRRHRSRKCDLCVRVYGLTFEVP